MTVGIGKGVNAVAKYFAGVDYLIGEADHGGAPDVMIKIEFNGSY